MPDTKPEVAFLVPFGAQIPSQGEGVKQYALVLSAAILADPQQITDMPRQPPAVLGDRAGKPVTELLPVAHIGTSPEALVALVAEHLLKAFTAAEENAKQQAEQAREAEEQDIRVLTEALQDVVKIPEGKTMVEAVGTYTLPVIVDALINRLANGIPLFVTTGEIERSSELHFGTPRSLHYRADLLAMQIGGQPAPIATRIMEGLQRNRYDLFKLVSDRFAKPEKYSSCQLFLAGEQVQGYTTPPELSDAELLALIPSHTTTLVDPGAAEEETAPETCCEEQPESELGGPPASGVHSGTRRK